MFVLCLLIWIRKKLNHTILVKFKVNNICSQKHDLIHESISVYDDDEGWLLINQWQFNSIFRKNTFQFEYESCLVLDWRTEPDFQLTSSQSNSLQKDMASYLNSRFQLVIMSLYSYSLMPVALQRSIKYHF